MPVTYKPAPTVADVATKLIENHHARLADEDVRFWFRSDARHSMGRDVWGDVKKITGLGAAMIREAAGETEDLLEHESADELLSAPMFVLVVPEDIWLILDVTTREALIFDLLCRCRIEGSEEGARLTLVGPDLVEFVDTIERYGLWRDSVRRAAAGMFKSHPTLFDPDEVDKLELSTDESPLEPSKAKITLRPVDGRWEGRCNVCDEFFSDDVRAQADAAVAEHLAMHNTQAEVAGALSSGEVDDEGDEGAFGAAFDDKIAALAEVETGRHLQVAR